MTYIIEFKNGQWLRVTEEQGLKIMKFLDDGKQWIDINGSRYATNTITKIEKDK